jgi:hypothetical protein
VGWTLPGPSRFRSYTKPPNTLMKNVVVLQLQQRRYNSTQGETFTESCFNNRYCPAIRFHFA